MNQRTKEKYMKLLNEIANKNQFKGSELVRNHSVASNIITAMMDTGLINKIDLGRYTWIMKRQPTYADAKLISHALRVRRLNTDSIKVGQLTMQPLKRVERIAPVRQPVQVEEQHTPYPIMDIVIAFLAGMIAAGFISIIWK
jgi:hypothetical protein